MSYTKLVVLIQFLRPSQVLDPIKNCTICILEKATNKRHGCLLEVLFLFDVTKLIQNKSLKRPIGRPSKTTTCILFFLSMSTFMLSSLSNLDLPSSPV